MGCCPNPYQGHGSYRELFFNGGIRRVEENPTGFRADNIGWHSVAEVHLASETDHSGSPPRRAAVQSEIEDERVRFKEAVDGPAQDALSFAVDDCDLEDALLLACPQVLVHHGRSILRPERVQIQHTVDGQVEFFHGVFDRPPDGMRDGGCPINALSYQIRRRLQGFK